MAAASPSPPTLLAQGRTVREAAARLRVGKTALYAALAAP
jgi:hypothetical protein